MKGTLSGMFRQIGDVVGGLPISYSRAELLFDCPLAFHLKYQKGIPEIGASVRSDDTRVGSLAHRLMERAVRGSMCAAASPQRRNFDFLHDEVLGEADNDNQKRILEEIKSPVGEVLGRVLKLTSKPGSIVMPEKKIRLDVYGRYMFNDRSRMLHTKRGDSCGFLGYVDLLVKNGNSMIIVDYKTELPTETREEQVRKQMRLYSYVEFLGDERIENATTYCIYLKSGDVVVIDRFRNRNLDELEDFVFGYIGAYMDRLKDIKPVPTIGKHCKYCGYAGTYCKLRGGEQDGEEGEREEGGA